MWFQLSCSRQLNLMVAHNESCCESLWEVRAHDACNRPHDIACNYHVGPCADASRREYVHVSITTEDADLECRIRKVLGDVLSPPHLQQVGWSAASCPIDEPLIDLLVQSASGHKYALRDMQELWWLFRDYFCYSHSLIYIATAMHKSSELDIVMISVCYHGQMPAHSRCMFWKITSITSSGEIVGSLKFDWPHPSRSAPEYNVIMISMHAVMN